MTHDATAFVAGMTVTLIIVGIIHAVRFCFPDDDEADEITDDPRPAQVLREGQRGVGL